MRPHVLIIDPVAADRTLLSAMLQIAGYAATGCAELADALTHLTAGPVRAVLADLDCAAHLPPAALAETLRRPAPQPVRAIALTSNPDLSARAARWRGFDGCLVKPVYREQVVAAVEGWPDPLR